MLTYQLILYRIFNISGFIIYGIGSPCTDRELRWTELLIPGSRFVSPYGENFPQTSEPHFLPFLPLPHLCRMYLSRHQNAKGIAGHCQGV